MNKIWHAKNKMPTGATLKQKAAWHKKHQKSCGCRKPPKSLLKYF
jgi:hypothetical protein